MAIGIEAAPAPNVIRFQNRAKLHSNGSMNAQISQSGFRRQKIRNFVAAAQAGVVAVKSSQSSNSLFTGSDDYPFEKEELNEDMESFAYLVNTIQCILHFKYRVGHYLDEYDAKLLQQEVLRFHPRAAEKVGCGVESIMVAHHPEFNRSRCFMIHRLDGSLCDFSYRKSMLERARLKGLNPFSARKLLNMDYVNLNQNTEVQSQAP